MIRVDRCVARPDRVLTAPTPTQADLVQAWPAELQPPTSAMAFSPDDRRPVERIIPNRKPNGVYHIRIDATTAQGEKMWSPEAWFTFHKAPAR